MAIDRMDWHYGEDNYPKDLPPENGGTHIGMYLAFVFSQGMAGEIHVEESINSLEKLKRREITGLDFLIHECDEKFWDEDLNEEGEAFTLDYYQQDSAFAKQFGWYMQDYCNVFNAHAAAQGFEYPSTYHVENTWQNFERLKPILDKRLQQWRSWRNAG